MLNIKIAVVGATGVVGREVLSILASSKKILKGNIVALASKESVGKSVSFGDLDTVTVYALETFVDFSSIDLAFFVSSYGVAKQYAKKFTENGSIVIDNSSCFRMDDDVPLIIPEINGDQIAKIFHVTKKSKNIISNPNCSVIQLLISLYELHKVAQVKRVVVSTYQSVSGIGKEGMDTLYNQTRSSYTFQNIDKGPFREEIAFNCIPYIGENEMESGWTGEEIKMHKEAKKIMSDQHFEISSTCVRVPVFIGHSQSVNVEFHNEMNSQMAKEILYDSNIVHLFNDSTKILTPKSAKGCDIVYISRIRDDYTQENTLSFWNVADNLRKGAALNAVQILFLLVENGYF